MVVAASTAHKRQGYCSNAWYVTRQSKVDKSHAAVKSLAAGLLQV